MRLTLTHFGHAIIAARDGKEGLTLFPQTNPDLLIPDIVMPEKEGVEVLLELRQKLPPVKIIVMSGGGLGNAETYLQAAKLMGAGKVFKKPFSNEALLAAVNEVLAAGK